MIKLALKLAVVALLANGVYRVGSEYLGFVRFRDRVRSAATYRVTTDDELRSRILALADEYDVPLGADDLRLERDNRLLTVNARYHKPIELLPRYSIEWPFDISMQVDTASAALLPGAPPVR